MKLTNIIKYVSAFLHQSLKVYGQSLGKQDRFYPTLKSPDPRKTRSIQPS